MNNGAVHPFNRLRIDLGVLEPNLKAMRSLLAPGLRVAAVVKADAYGHGMVPAVRILKSAGVEWLAVTFLAEAAELRSAGVRGPIMVLSGITPGQAEQAVALQATPVLWDRQGIETLAAAARRMGRPATCHINVDTGIGRLGLTPSEALPLLRWAAKLEGLEVTGLMSHLATAGDPDGSYAQKQAAQFSELLSQARGQGFALPDSSLTPSGAVLAPPAAAPGPPGLVRLGVSLYGGLPHPALATRVSLQGAMTFSSRLVQVRPLAQGASVSYGRTWQAPEDTWLAAVPVGYADGYLRSLSNRGRVLIDGQEAPVRGRVCMSMIMVEVAHLDPLPKAGDTVVLLGSQGPAAIGVDQLAAWADTIPYELMCALGAANRRLYTQVDHGESLG